jgi:hypothetical protein
VIVNSHPDGQNRVTFCKLYKLQDMTANNKYRGVPDHLVTGLVALVFALVACLYLFRNEQTYNDPEDQTVLEEFITEPLPPVIPGLWQIAY